MPLQRMPRRQSWVIKIFRWVMIHADRFKRVIRHGASALCRVTSTPILTCEAPTDLDRRCEVSIERNDSQTDEADEFLSFALFRRTQTKTMLFEMSFDPIDKFIAFVAGKHRGKKFHHARIGVHHRKRLPVGFPPAP